MDNLMQEYNKLLEAANGAGSAGVTERIRDLTLIRLLGGLRLVIACDSNASNGEKPMDSHRNTYEEMAVSALKVPVMEVLATGAFPIVIANNLCVEMEPSGRRIIDIMKQELMDSGLWQGLQFTGSTEDNMKTVQSGVGVTVIGLLNESKSKLGGTQKGDVVICVGIPQSGVTIPYSERDRSVCKIRTVEQLRRMDFVHEILPIGSKGAEYEAQELAGYVGLSFQKDTDCRLDLKTSAGSSTAVLVSTAPEAAGRLIQEVDVPAARIGTII